ncbi:MAG: cobalt ECF transporter T component CbiQ [Actinomycetales bacterium]
MTTITAAPHQPGGLYLAGARPSLVHRLPAQVKVVAAFVLVGSGVAIPASALSGAGAGVRWLALAGILVLALTVVGFARLRPRQVLSRMVVEVPFVIFALAMPLVAAGPRIEVGGVWLSQAGLIGAGALLLKVTTGVLVGIVLAATTTPHELLDGLRRLRLPAVIIGITSFMIRYASVVIDDVRRMRTAREARGYTGGRRGHLRYEAAGVGTLFIRSFERGERVHRAMLARGYQGELPSLNDSAASPGQWLTALAIPSLAVVICLLARIG